VIDVQPARDLRMNIRARDLMPMFTVTNLADSTRIDYQVLWQRTTLLLATLPDDDPTATAYAASLSVLAASLASLDVALIVTTTRIIGIPSPCVVVADRWGEVYYVSSASLAPELPAR
jgi:hypothetical protein